MNNGRISYKIADRSVRKQMKSGSGLLPGFMQYRDCAVLPGGDTDVVTSVFSSVIDSDRLVRLLFYRGCNQLAAQRADTAAVSAAFVLPAGKEEAWLAERVSELTDLCGQEGAAFGQTFATVSDAVKQPVLTLTFTGVISRHEGSQKKPSEKAALIAAGHAGMAGSGFLASERNSELKQHYAGGFIDGAAAFWERLSVKAAAAAAPADTWLFPVKEGGVFAALWYLANGLGLGFDISMKRIPIRQETVEICEYYRLNPYLLAVDGMMLAVTDRNGKLTPLWFRFETEEHQIEKIAIEKTISSDECAYTGIREKKFI